MQFEPFTDRLSRDIRNDLSETIRKVIEQQDIGTAEKVAEKYLGLDIDLCFKKYIRERLARYRSVIAKISDGPDDIFWQALVLWDQQLFFEVHELLEHAWYDAVNPEKEILQAMIRAAGVYIKLEFGYVEAARKMADRSLQVLGENRDFLARYFEPDKLLSALQDCRPEPPLLLE